MIIKNYDIVYYPITLDIGRPSFYDDKTFDYWNKFFHIVETTEVPLLVNEVYYDMKNMCESKQGYHGGGFKFMFWFRCEEDRMDFVKEVNQNLLIKEINL